MSDKELSRQLWNCGAWSIFGFLCPKTWASLSPTDDVSKRLCSLCKEHVFLCSTPEDLVELGRSGKCVAILPNHTRQLANASYLGRPSKALLDSSADAKKFWEAVDELNRRDAIQHHFLILSEGGQYRSEELDFIIVDIGKLATNCMTFQGGRLHKTDQVGIGSYGINAAIVEHLRISRNFLIGDVTAQYIRTSLVTQSVRAMENTISIKGRDLAEGVPREYIVSSNEVLESIQPLVDVLMASVNDMLQSVDLDAREQLVRNGIYITGESCINGIENKLADTSSCSLKIAAASDGNEVISSLCKAVDEYASIGPRFARKGD